MKPLEDWKVRGPERFSGLMDYNKTVTVETAEGQLLLDLGRVCNAAEVWVNEKDCGERLWGPHTFDISGAVRPGSNRIRVRVANLINNSYGEYQESGLLGPVRILRIRELHWCPDVNPGRRRSDLSVGPVCQTGPAWGLVAERIHSLGGGAAFLPDAAVCRFWKISNCRSASWVLPRAR
jgi:hypothetical protein